MDYLLVRNSGLVVSALVIVGCLISVLYDFLNHRRIPGTVMWLLFGAIAMLLDLLDWTGSMFPEWPSEVFEGVLGVWFLWRSIPALASISSPDFPRWTQWATFVLGAYFMVLALDRFWL